MDQYFHQTIWICNGKHRNKEKFSVKPTATNQPIVVFRGYRGQVYLNYDVNNIECKKAISMRFADILYLHSIPEFPLEDFREYEIRYNLTLKFYKQNGEKFCQSRELPPPNEANGKSIIIGVDKWVPETTFAIFSSTHSIVGAQYQCDKCSYVCKREWNLKNEHTCSEVSEVISKQCKLGENYSELKELVKMEYLPETITVNGNKMATVDYRQDKVVVYDIETLEQKPSDPTYPGLPPEALLNPVSIGAASNIPGFEEAWFCRSNSAGESAQTMVDAFMNFLIQIQIAFLTKLPPCIETAYNTIEAELETDVIKQNVEKRTKLVKLKHFLTKYLTLNVWSFNGGKFDIPVLLNYITVYCTSRDLDLSPIKRGSQYMALNVDNLFKFTDIINMSSPCSLDKYLRQWKAKVNKSIFPYR